MGSCSEERGCVGKTSACLSGSREAGPRRRNSQRLLAQPGDRRACRLRQSPPPALPLPGPALCDPAGPSSSSLSCHRVQSSPPTACALFENIPVPVTPPPPSPNVAISHGLVGSPGWLPTPSCAPPSPQSPSLCFWMPSLGSHFGLSVSTSALPAGSLADVALRSIPTRAIPRGHSLDCRASGRLPFICSTCSNPTA